MRVALVVLVLVAMASTACAEEADVTDPGPYIDAMADDVRQGSGLPAEDDQAECIATAMVDVVGADRLRSEGVSPEDFVAADSFDDLGVELDDDDLEQLGDDLAGCDLAAVFVPMMLAESGGELSTDASACVEDEIDPQAFGAAVAQALVSNDAAAATAVAGVLAEALGSCPAAITELVVVGIEAESGVSLSEEAVECIEGEVADQSDLWVEALTGIGPTAEELGESIGFACASEIAG
jgi:hypothetical protein